MRNQVDADTDHGGDLGAALTYLALGEDAYALGIDDQDVVRPLEAQPGQRFRACDCSNSVNDGHTGNQRELVQMGGRAGEPLQQARIKIAVDRRPVAARAASC